MSQKISPKWYIQCRGIKWKIPDFARLRDPCFKIRDWDLKKSRLREAKSPKNETSRLTIYEISRSGQNFSRPTFFEEPFYTPSISNDTSKKNFEKRVRQTLVYKKHNCNPFQSSSQNLSIPAFLPLSITSFHFLVTSNVLNLFLLILSQQHRARFFLKR